MKSVVRTGLVLVLLVSVVVPLSATTALRMNNQDLAAQAEVIVIGRATDSRAVWDGRVLVTAVTIAVSDTIKGEPGATVTVALPGGIDANRRIPIAMTYPGAPTIAPDEEVFLFLARNEATAGSYVVLGFSQGKFSVAQEPGGRKVVTRDLTQILLQGGTGVVRGAKTYTSLAEFRSEIAGYIR